MGTPLTPEKIAETQTEHAQQVALFCWAALPETRKQCPGIEFMFAIPNGESRGETPEQARRVGGRLKAEGVKAGVSDIFLPVPIELGQQHSDCWHHGLFIEMKQPPNKATAEQIGFLGMMAENGYKIAICYSFAEAKAAILAYYQRQ